MHNNIMAVGSRDRPLMLATGRYPQWRSRFLRYIDTRPNGAALRKCILSEKEAIHLILTGIGDEIYLTIDACQTTQEIWEAIKRLQQGKEIAKPITPPSESASEEDNDPEQAQRDKDMQKNLAFIAKYFKKIYKPTNNHLRTSLNSKNKNVDTSLRMRYSVLIAKQSDWLADIDEEVDEQELKAHYSLMEKIQEVPTVDLGTDTEPLEQVQYNLEYNVFANETQHSEQPESISNTCLVEKVDSNVIPGSLDMTTQTRAPQLPQTSRNTNPRVSTSTRVIHKTNVSRPPLRSTQMKDKFMPNNSYVKFKKTEVKDHHKISSISNKTKSVTACNDSLQSRSSNVNVVCATCGKCVFNSNHDACISKFLNDMNARTKKLKVVPISTRKPISQANKLVATPYKKTVASESTTQNSKSYYRMLYMKTSKAWKWWIEQ
nr:hypothetical protein [Tanacetum cinerariifolium]